MENLNSFFKGLNLKSRGRLFGFGESPEADWKVIFVSAAFLALLATAINVYIFVKIDKGEIFVVEPAGQGERSLNLSKLRETVGYYQSKAQNFESIKNAVVSPSVDPSI